MSKLSKLIQNPKLFFDDMLIKRGFKKKPVQTKLASKPSASKPSASKPSASKPSASKPSASKPSAVSTVVPDWFSTASDYNSTDFIKPVFMYLPWIEGHGDALIRKINNNHFSVLPLPFISDVTDNELRRSVLRFAREHPDIYRKLVIKALLPYKNKIDGFIFTFDWAPIMRIIVDVCKDFGIPAILIPHESVFADREMYYKDPTALASTPKADLVLSWGQLQSDIFEERGYPRERIKPVGAPKFDTYYKYEPLLNREQFCKIFNLDTNKEIILFAAQPLDSQFITRVARETQRQAIKDLFDFAGSNDMQLIVRMPPSKDILLNRAITNEIERSNFAVIDDANYYLVPPEEAIYHSKYVTSINSTMLFEAMLMDRFAFSMKYLDFDQIWAKAGIPAVKNKDQLFDLINKMRDGELEATTDEIKWAAQQFGVGEFDGLASTRIINELIAVSEQFRSGQFELYPSSLERFLSKHQMDVVGVSSSQSVLANAELYIPELLKANTVLSTLETHSNIKELASVELFFESGIQQSVSKSKRRLLSNSLGKSIAIIEDGLIRSVEKDLSGNPTLSIITDDLASYYDSTVASRLETYLEYDQELPQAIVDRTEKAIDKLVNLRVSKYNQAKSWPLQIGREGKKKILLIDQRNDDLSVSSSLANDDAFDQMLIDVLVSNPDADIIIKQHPSVKQGENSSYYSKENIEKYLNIYDNIYLLNIDINPYAIFEIVDEVYVVSSLMGFEALMAGKPVHCYGAPFYSGWGLTNDKVKVERRTRSRSISDVFYYAYIQLSRYYNPELKEVVEVEDFMDYIVANRGW